MNIIFKMIKFVLLALLSFSLNDEIFGRFEEDKVGSDGYHLELKFDDGVCCKDKKAEDASPENEPICLNSKNSQLIADQTLIVLKRADTSYEALKALKIPEFMISKITYQEWAANIEYGNYNLEGFSKLKELVTKFVLCKKVCKVFFFLRESLREHAAVTNVEDIIEDFGDYQEKYIKISGDLIILGDVRKAIELTMAAAEADGQPYVGVLFESETMIIDSNLLDNKGWAGKNILLDVENVIVPKSYSWYVDGNEGQLNTSSFLCRSSFTQFCSQSR